MTIANQVQTAFEAKKLSFNHIVKLVTRDKANNETMYGRTSGSNYYHLTDGSVLKVDFDSDSVSEFKTNNTITVKGGQSQTGTVI